MRSGCGVKIDLKGSREPLKGREQGQCVTRSWGSGWISKRHVTWEDVEAIRPQECRGMEARGPCRGHLGNRWRDQGTDQVGRTVELAVMFGAEQMGAQQCERGT